ncbi:DUF3300 domain-containing protein [Arsukibacterium sp.]|uniref:DUF3300 domain-containing protein n=1 Tax=Arsukibacterium sp. TaxID=1977258 RepID=UPI002FDB1964
MNRLPNVIRILLLSMLLLASNSFAQPQSRVLSDQQLDQMLAPVALYPDALLTHVLIAATYPLEVVQAHRWLQSQPGLNGEAAVNAATEQDWDPSVQALTAFPNLLERLNDDLQWTQQLGEAFLADEAQVLASIQRLRLAAEQHGSLAQLEHVVVEREREVIVIEPAQREVIYVPYYDSRVVYGSWWYPAYPPVYWYTPGVHFSHSYVYWGPSVIVRPGFYFSIFDWHHRHIIVNHHYYHRPPRYYPKRHHHYADAHRWQHNNYHRRGVHYRQPQLNQQFNGGYGQQSTREYSRMAQDQRPVRQQQTEHQYQRRSAEQVSIRQGQPRPQHDSNAHRQMADATPRVERNEPVSQERRSMNPQRRLEQIRAEQQSERIQPERDRIQPQRPVAQQQAERVQPQRDRIQPQRPVAQQQAERVQPQPDRIQPQRPVAQQQAERIQPQRDRIQQRPAMQQQSERVQQHRPEVQPQPQIRTTQSFSTRQQQPVTQTTQQPHRQQATPQRAAVSAQPAAMPAARTENRNPSPRPQSSTFNREQRQQMREQ